MHVIAMHSTQPWPRKARDSVEAAAARWKCDVRVFDFPYAPHPSWARLELAKHLLGYERALVVDPDIFISDDCPDLFAGVPATHVGMAMELQAAEDSVGPYPWAGALAGWRNVLGRRVAIERHLQGGVCVYTPARHVEHFEKMLGWWSLHGRFSHRPVYEQPLWHEVGERLFNLPIRRLSRLLNRHTRALHARPRSYVMHLTGGDKHERMQATGWQGGASEPLEIVARACGGEMAPRLMELLRAGVFHERIVVVGDELAQPVQVLADVTAGMVTWVTTRSAGAPQSMDEGRSHLRCVQTDVTRVVRAVRPTLLVEAGASGEWTWRELEEIVMPASGFSRVWSSAWQPDAPLGRVRQAAVRVLMR